MLTWFGIYTAFLAAMATWKLSIAALKTAVDMHDARQRRDKMRRALAYLREVQTVQPKTREQMEDIASKHGLAIDEDGSLTDKEPSQE